MRDIRTITVTLIRHAPSVHEQGSLPPYDPPLAPINSQQISPQVSQQVSQQVSRQISQLAAALPKNAPWWISPLARCRMTADALLAAGAEAASTECVDALEEQRYGDWHGQAISTIWDELKDGPKSNWHFLHPSITPPHGESFDDLVARMTPLMEQITWLKDDHLVIIAHGMVIRAMIGLALSFDPGQSLAMDIANLSATRLTYMADGALTTAGAGGKWYLGCLNQCY